MPTTFRTVIIAASFWVFSLPLTVLTGSVAAVAGSVLACYGADFGGSRPRPVPGQPAPPLRGLAALRTGVISLGALGLLIIGVGAARLMLGSTLLAELFSPIGLFEATQALTWFSIAFSITLMLRVLAQRNGYGAVLEIVWVATAFVVALSAHRNGMIHRPFFIGDFALIRGMDPSHILIAVGCAAMLGLSTLMVAENNRWRLPYHFAVLGLLCLPLLAYMELFGLPTPQFAGPNPMGEEAGGGGDQRRDRNPFRDGDNDASSRQAPVAVVVFRDDYEPWDGSYYFREGAYSQFNGLRLYHAERADMDRDLIKEFPSGRADAARTPGPASDHIPVRTTVGTLISQRTPFGLSTPVAFEAVANPNTLRFKRTYDTHSLAPTYDITHLLGRRTGNPDWPAELRGEYLKLPDDPRYRERADELIAGAKLRPEFAGDAAARIWAIKSWLDDNGIYSLANEHAEATDPAASFLFGDLTGYCTHFAFAATYLYRSIGIPARVGLGYAVPAANRADGSALLVQAIHAHAWPEVYFEDIGWVIMDLAPSQTVVDMTTPPQNELQQLLGDMLRNDASFDEFLDARRQAWIPWRLMLQVTVLSLLAALLGAYCVKWYRQMWSGGDDDGQCRRVYRAILDQLAGFGLRRRYGESREGFARRVSDLSPSFPRLTEAHLQLALGGAGALSDARAFSDARALSETRAESPQIELRGRIRRELRQNTRLWQRLLGALNPVSWLWSR